MGDERTPGGTGRRRSARGHGEQLRAEILDGVNRLLVDWGSAEKLTIRAVAREVGVAAPSIYLHFTDKAELVWAALAGKYAELAELMRAAAEHAQSQGPRERLRAEVHAYCRFALKDPGHYRLMYEVEQPAVEVARLSRHPSRMVTQRFRVAIAECRDAGFPPSLPVEQTAHTLWAGLHGNVTLGHTFAEAASTEELLLGLADGLLGALVPGDAQQRADLAAHGDRATMRVLQAVVLDTE